MLLAAAGAACTAHHAPTLVPLLQEPSLQFSPTPPVPLEVVTRSTSERVHDPLPVDGSDVVYGDVESALGHAVAVATVPWAQEHSKDRPEGWQLMVELTDAEAKALEEGRLKITLGVRATLRTRTGNAYMAQKNALCAQSGVISADRGVPVLYNCMTRIGRDLSNWLAGVQP